MASARKLPSGSWRCRVFSHYEYRDGKKVAVQKSFTVDDPSPRGKHACEQMASDWAEKKNARPWNTDVYTAIRKYIDTKKGVLSPSTVTAYERYLKNGNFSAIGAIHVQDLKQMDVQRWVSEFAADHSPKYVRNVYALMQAAVSFSGGPEYKVTFPRPRRKEIYTPTDSEIVQLIEYCRRPGKEELLGAVLLAAFGSLRRSEICALTPADIQGNKVIVNKAMVRADKTWEIKTTKTEDSARFVVIPSFVLNLIPQGGPRIVNCDPDALSSRFKRAIKYAGIDNTFTIHALRHYYVSAAHALNIADQYTMKMGGWHTDHTMKRHYRTTLSDIEKQEQEKMDRHTLQLIQRTS